MPQIATWHDVAQQIVTGLQAAPGTATHDIALARLCRMAAIAEYHLMLEEEGESENVSALLPDRIEHLTSRNGNATRA